MKRMLHIVGGMYPGGLENFIMNIYRNLDREKVQFDVIVHSIREGDYTKEIEHLGGKVYLAPRKSKHPIGNFLAIRRIVKENGYQTVIRHSDNAFPVLDLLAARMAGAKRRIYQSHSSNSSHVGLHKFFRMFMGCIPTDRFACSENAGRWMYGNRKFEVVKNAIDVEQYRFDAALREKVRKEWQMENCVVYSHVGIYMPAKNHKFLIAFFHEIVKKQPSAKLLLIGEGGLREEIERQVDELNLQEHVILTGIRSDVPELLQMTDVFLFPSIYEGLPLSVIEAQAAGLPCLISDGITTEVVVTDQVTRMSLADTKEAWAEQAVKLSEMPRDAWVQLAQDQVMAAGYDVKRLAGWYAEL